MGMGKLKFKTKVLVPILTKIKYTYSVTLDARSYNQCCSGKTKRIVYSGFVSVTLVIQHPMRMRLVILLSVARLFYQIFPRYLISAHDFRRKGS
jgi:hypothetical protein